MIMHVKIKANTELIALAFFGRFIRFISDNTITGKNIIKEASCVNKQNKKAGNANRVLFLNEDILRITRVINRPI